MGPTERLRDLDLELPAAPRLPPGHTTAFAWVRVLGARVLVSGHGPQQRDGAPAGPFGRVPDAVSLDQAQRSARLSALSVMGSVQRAIGDLDRIAAWVSVAGFVQARPGFPETTAVLNAFSDLVLDVFGPVVGAHTRTAIGVAALPLDLPVIVAAELALAG